MRREEGYIARRTSLAIRVAERSSRDLVRLPREGGGLGPFREGTKQLTHLEREAFTSLGTLWRPGSDQSTTVAKPERQR